MQTVPRTQADGQTTHNEQARKASSPDGEITGARGAKAPEQEASLTGENF